MVKTDRLAKNERTDSYLQGNVFFGELQTKRPNTVKSKLAEFLMKEDQLRKCVLFKIMRERGGEGPRGRSPPSNFELKDITFGGFIDEKIFSFH